MLGLVVYVLFVKYVMPVAGCKLLLRFVAALTPNFDSGVFVPSGET